MLLFTYITNSIVFNCHIDDVLILCIKHVKYISVIGPINYIFINMLIIPTSYSYDNTYISNTYIHTYIHTHIGLIHSMAP
jgi:hypothetical protein